MTLCRRTFLFTVLNAFVASIRSTASVSCSLKISCIAWTAASLPASWPAQTCSEPTDSVISSRIVDTTTLPVIHLRISPVPIGRKPRFLSRGVSLHATNASNFCVILTIALHKSEELSPIFLLVRIVLHPSSSIAEGPEPPFVFSAAFLTDSSVMFSNVIG